VSDDVEPPAEPGPPGEEPGQEQRTIRIQRQSREGRENTERLATRLFDQWNRLREERQVQLAPPRRVAGEEGDVDGLSRRRAEVPYGVELTASWAWRFLVIVAAAWVVFRALGFLETIVIPVVIALLITALMAPVVGSLRRLGLPRGPASLLAVILVIAVVGAMLFFAGHQVATGANDLANQASQGLGEIRDWLKTGPLHASDSQVDGWINDAQTGIVNWGKKLGENPLGKISEVGGVALDVIAGLFIILFSTFFFLAEGDLIWRWVVKLTPRAARERVDSSGRVAWISLTQFVRATVIVAAVDAIGIMVVAAILRVPFVAAIGVLVFLGAFIPMIGATVAGTVAVLVALVDHGFVTALIMLGGVILVQQLEAHGLQPFLMGRWVRVHPLGVILSLAAGIIIAGVPGALVAVPLAAAVNAVGRHLAAESVVADEAGLTPEEPGDE
jgi:putative heme transporter